MAGFIPEQILEEIQLRSDIVEVVSQYIPLKRAGANFKAPCPFHNEHTPSFIVSPSKQIFHCFGCGAGGNVFGFIMQYEHLGFVDAVKLLAGKSGIAIPENVKTKDTKGTKGLLDINKFAAEQFHKWLCDPKIGKPAYEYLKKRGIKNDTIKKFQLGFAPLHNELLGKAKEKDFPVDVLKRAGLVVGNNGSFHDMFRNRLIFPIFNTIGKVVGFSGRILDKAMPKYINTPETQIFHKGKILYGLHASKAEIIKQRQVLICEGHFDFIRLFQEGIRYAVASQGTAFTQDQVHALRRYTDEIIVAFDSDTAGNKAALAGLEMFLEEGLRVRIISLPEPYDPDLFIKDKGVQSFSQLIAKARDILDVKLLRLCKEYSIKTVDGKLKIVGQLLPDINKIKNDIWKRQFIKKIAAKLDIPEDTLWIELKRLKRPYRKKNKETSSSFTIGKIASQSGSFSGERLLIQLLLNDDPLPELIRHMLDLSELQSQEHREVLALIMKLKNSEKWKGLSSLMAHIKDENLMRLVSQLAAGEISCIDREKAIIDCLYNIRRKYRSGKIKEFIGEMERAEKGGEDISNLVYQINQLQKELIQLEQNFKSSVSTTSHVSV